jgi:hypothetical protein
MQIEFLEAEGRGKFMCSLFFVFCGRSSGEGGGQKLMDSVLVFYPIEEVIQIFFCIC